MNDDTSPISFVKGVNPLGSFNIDTALTGLEVNGSWRSSSTGQKNLFGKAKKAAGQDLDLVCIASQGVGPKALCWWGDLDPLNGALVSRGDDRRGRSGETIAVDFGTLPAFIDRLTFMLVAYKNNVSFSMVNGVSTSITDPNDLMLGQFMPDIDAANNCLVIAQLVKVLDGSWKVQEANAMTTIARGGSDGGRGAMLRVGRSYAEQL